MILGPTTTACWSLATLNSSWPTDISRANLFWSFESPPCGVRRLENSLPKTPNAGDRLGQNNLAFTSIVGSAASGRPLAHDCHNIDRYKATPPSHLLPYSLHYEGSPSCPTPRGGLYRLQSCLCVLATTLQRPAWCRSYRPLDGLWPHLRPRTCSCWCK